jgi:predicted anti-sigma-YlaC factor YlaD
MFPRPLTVLSHAGAVALLAATLAGCSVKTMAVKAVANSLAAPSDVMTRDDDPQLVKDAIPFGLKTYESLLESVPKHQPLLIATCSGYTSYAYAFVQTPAELEQFTDRPASRAGIDRALKMNLRAKGYCMRALELRYPGIGQKLRADPDAALAKTTRKDVELLYWTAASWGSAMSLGKDQPDLVIDFPIVRAMASRALALDPEWSTGSIHELFITLDSQPEALGGSPDGARKHFAEAVRIQKGQLPGPYVELAEGQSIFNQDRAEFEKLMNQAVALDVNVQPSVRLVSLIMQSRAKGCLEHIDDLFSK